MLIIAPIQEDEQIYSGKVELLKLFIISQRAAYIPFFGIKKS